MYRTGCSAAHIVVYSTKLPIIINQCVPLSLFLACVLLPAHDHDGRGVDGGEGGGGHVGGGAGRHSDQATHRG